MTDSKNFERVEEFLRTNPNEFKKLKQFVIKNVSLFAFFEEKGVEMDGSVSAKNVTYKCPFHTTDSFDSGRGTTKDGVELYFCNNPTCPVHGKALDVIACNKAFILKETGMQVSYTYALLDLYCNRLGKELPTVFVKEQTPEEIAAEKDKYMTCLLFLHITAIAKKLLNDPKLGEEGRKYLQGRKISQSFWKVFHMGWIPSGYKISEDLISKGFTKEFLAEKGIISKTTGNDTLFNRIVIPMWAEGTDVLDPNFVFKDAVVDNLYTRTVIIKNDKDKAYKHRYINRELPFYNIKSCLGKQNIILVEGIIDCLSIQDVLIKMRGIVNTGKTFNLDPLNTGVAATYGTNGLSDEKMKKYLGSFKNIFLAADNDTNNAGQTANIKRAKTLSAMFPNANIKLVSWNKKDANDMLVSGAKPEEFWACLEKSVSLEEFCVANVSQKLNSAKNSIEETFKVLEEIKPILDGFDTSDPLRVYAFSNFVSQNVKIPIEVVLFAILKTKVSNPLEIINKILNQKDES